MGLLARTTLRLALATAFVGCYSPETQECTVKCTSADDCAGGQTCGRHGFCVGDTETVCMTGGGATVDAGTSGGGGSGNGSGSGSATPQDAGAPPVDAPTTGTLTVRTEGRGYIHVDGVGTCSSAAPDNGTCTYTVSLSESLTARSFPELGWYFDRWQTSTCPDDESSTCDFDAAANVEIAAKFRRLDGDDD